MRSVARPPADMSDSGAPLETVYVAKKLISPVLSVADLELRLLQEYSRDLTNGVRIKLKISPF
jgi:hypothetical protein